MNINTNIFNSNYIDEYIFERDLENFLPQELSAFEKLKENCLEIVGPGAWDEGIPIIKKTHFPEYAKEEALKSCGVSDSSAATWLFNYIDWSEVVKDLRWHYQEVHFMGEPYLIKTS